MGVVINNENEIHSLGSFEMFCDGLYEIYGKKEPRMTSVYLA